MDMIFLLFAESIYNLLHNVLIGFVYNHPVSTYAMTNNRIHKGRDDLLKSVFAVLCEHPDWEIILPGVYKARTCNLIYY